MPPGAETDWKFRPNHRGRQYESRPILDIGGQVARSDGQPPARLTDAQQQWEDATSENIERAHLEPILKQLKEIIESTVPLSEGMMQAQRAWRHGMKSFDGLQ